jgi:predicted aspartyl protease
VPAASFSFHGGLPVIDVSFIERESGITHRRRLLVDSGFSGASDVVLSYADARRFGFHRLPATRVGGAISGAQIRTEVHAGLVGVLPISAIAAICADLAPLSLPDGVHGIAGLTFLCRFRRWGAEQRRNGTWSFLVDTDPS